MDSQIQDAIKEALAVAKETDGWKVSDESNGAKLDLKAVPGSSINAARVKGTVRASPEKLADLMFGWAEADWKKWSPDIESWGVVEQVSDDTRVVRQVNKLSWPLWNRETVFFVAKRKLEDGSYIIVVKSVDHDKAPKQDDKFVRAKILISFFLFEPIEGGHSNVTRVLHVDPAGNIPTAVINANIKSTHAVIESFNKLVA